MDYSLIKRLEASGFPMPPRDAKHDTVKSPEKTEGHGVSYELLAVPSLSELIEACGDGFDRLERWEEGDQGNIWWQAHMSEGAWKKYAKANAEACIIECDGYEDGPTPEIAVANLYLALYP